MRPLTPLLCFAALLASGHAHALERNKRIRAMKGVVMVMAAEKRGDKFVAVGRGSGSIINDEGLILTNNHVVADPKTGAPFDVVAVGLTTAFDKEPRLTCLAFPSRAIRDPALDLAVIKCEAEVNGKPLKRKIDWPAVSMGDTSQLVPGDELYVVGYPAIGGSTITFSAGKASGFLDEKGLARAWIKTDALISPGVSGGAVFDDSGKLVGVPTQLRWNRGGRTNIGIVRPIDRARGLLGRVLHRDWNKIPRSRRGAGGKVRLQLGLVTASGGLDERAVRQTLTGRLSALGACYAGALGRTPGLTGYAEIHLAIAAGGQISAARAVRSTVGDSAMMRCLGTELKQTGFPATDRATRVTMLLVFSGQAPRAAAAPAPSPAPRPTPAPTPTPPPAPRRPPPSAAAPEDRPRRIAGASSHVAGLVVDASTNQRIAGALVVLVKPGVRVRSLTRGNLAASIATAGESTSQGRFRSKVPVPQGQTYGLLVLARGYHPLAVDNAVQVLRGAPPVLNLGLIRLRPRGY